MYDPGAMAKVTNKWKQHYIVHSRHVGRSWAGKFLTLPPKPPTPPPFGIAVEFQEQLGNAHGVPWNQGATYMQHALHFEETLADVSFADITFFHTLVQIVNGQLPIGLTQRLACDRWRRGMSYVRSSKLMALLRKDSNVYTEPCGRNALCHSMPLRIISYKCDLPDYQNTSLREKRSKTKPGSEHVHFSQQIW